jgi:hypothetical protein
MEGHQSQRRREAERGGRRTEPQEGQEVAQGLGLGLRNDQRRGRSNFR